MADKMEREIEEILAKLDGEAGDKAPISILSRRKRPPSKTPGRRRRAPALPGVTPTTLLFTGAGIMVAGLVLSSMVAPLIWASFAGVVIFLGAFFWSFRRTNRGAHGAPGAPRGHYWRDRFIEYEPASSGLAQRIKRRFRRR